MLCHNIYLAVFQQHKYINKLWEKGSDGITFADDTEYLINAIWKAWYNDTGKDPEFGEIPNDITPSATKDVKMRFKYVRRRNIDLVHSRKTKGNMNNITTIHQQRDASVELNEYKKNLKLYSNRMGNNMYSKTKIFNYPDEPYELFDYTDEKTIVTRVQNTYHNKFVYCEYEESENFSNIEAEYALMRRSDPYTITAKSVTTNLIYQEFIEFSTIQRDLNTRFEDEARELLAGQFDTSPIALEKVAVGVFKPDLTSWNTLHAIHMPVEASGDGNLITVHVQFTHQNIAGKTYYDLDNSTYQTYLNPLPYTDVDGRLEDFELFFTPDILVEDSGEYPLILNDANYLLNAYTTSGLTDPLDLDSAASFAETLQVSLVADENIYIGNVLASDNFFIKDQVLPAPGIEIYTSTKPYGQYDQAPRDDDTVILNTTVSLATYNYSFANRTITIKPSIEVDYFSIVRNGKILLAVNQNIPAGVSYTIYLNYVREIFVVLMEAYATDLSDLSISLTLAYSNRLYDLEAKSSALSILDVSATLAYTDRTFTMSAKSSALSSISGTCALAYTASDYSLEAYSSAFRDKSVNVYTSLQHFT